MDFRRGSKIRQRSRRSPRSCVEPVTWPVLALNPHSGSQTSAKIVSVTFADFMETLEDDVARCLRTSPTVRDVDAFPDLAEIRHGDEWVRMHDVVAVVADLKGSTQLSLNRYVNTTVRIYQAATGGGVKVATRFGPAFTDIQGDGFFCLFHGDDAYRNSMAAAMSLAYFSKEILEPAIKNFSGAERVLTGLKIGVDIGRLAVGRVGVRGTSELIWPGKPVNRAFKCSGAADRHQVVVTSRVFSGIVEKNEFLLRPCYVRGHGHGLLMWSSISVRALPGESCWVRKVPWCPEVIDTFCDAVLNGETVQPASTFQRSLYYLGL
jgi:class 3 adenylate cyclase